MVFPSKTQRKNSSSAYTHPHMTQRVAFGSYIERYQSVAVATVDPAEEIKRSSSPSQRNPRHSVFTPSSQLKADELRKKFAASKRQEMC